MKRALAIVAVNVVWPVLGWLWLTAGGEFIFRVPEGVLPQWFFGLSTIALAGGAFWLNASIYVGFANNELPFVSTARRGAALPGAVGGRAGTPSVSRTHSRDLSTPSPVVVQNRGLS